MTTNHPRFAKSAAALLTVMLAGTLAACSSTPKDGASGTPPEAAACAPADGPVTLTFASWIPGMEEVVKLWNDKNPDIQVKVDSVPGGANGTYQNYSNAIQAKNTPDIGQMEFYAIPSFRVQDGLRDIGGCEGVAESKSLFPEGVWDQISLGQDGVAYAIPQDTGPLGMYYRKDLFEKAGIPVPTTWEEFAVAAEKIAATGTSIANFSASSGEIPQFVGLVTQAGGQWFNADNDTWTVSLTSPESVKVADYWQDLLAKKYVSTVPGFTDTWNHAFNTDQIWTWMSGPWGANGLMGGAPDTAGGWAVAPLPQ